MATVGEGDLSFNIALANLLALPTATAIADYRLGDMYIGEGF